MEPEIEVKNLVAHIKSCSLQIPVRNPPHQHVGSIIADAVLQVGHRWKTHVGPRLERMRNLYAEDSTISKVSDLLDTEGAQKLLNWKGKDAQKRFSQSIHFFENEQVETFENLREWLESDDNRDRLITKSSRSDNAGIPKIADATADYYRVLVGLPDAVKVDSLVQKFLADAGIEVKKYTYEEKRSIVQLAAKQLRKRPIDLDGAIWNYEEKDNKEKHEMEQDKGLMIPLPKDKIEQLDSIAKEFNMDRTTLAKFWIIEHLLGFGAQRSSLQTFPKGVGSPTFEEIIVSGKVIATDGENKPRRELGRISKNDCQRITGEGGPLDVSIAEKKFGAKWSESGTVLEIPIKLLINKVTYDAKLHHRKKTEKVWIGSPLNNGKVKLAEPLAREGFKAKDNVKLNVLGNRIQVEK